ncbi:MAG: tetratricopeptide repeat protein, partial [Steroidobacteraceae bacterium]
MPPGRNEPCSCGSGRKYKLCCGKAPADRVAPNRPLSNEGRARDALAPLESAGRTRPGDAQVHYLLGQALEEQGLLERAAESFGRATALDPEFADAHNDLGEVLLRLGRTDAAIASCQRALALRPRFAAALGNLANAD